jgi:hypothetical protein
VAANIAADIIQKDTPTKSDGFNIDFSIKGSPVCFIVIKIDYARHSDLSTVIRKDWVLIQKVKRFFLVRKKSLE